MIKSELVDNEENGVMIEMEFESVKQFKLEIAGIMDRIMHDPKLSVLFVSFLNEWKSGDIKARKVVSGNEYQA